MCIRDSYRIYRHSCLPSSPSRRSWSWKWKPPERSTGSTARNCLSLPTITSCWKAMYPCRICLIRKMHTYSAICPIYMPTRTALHSLYATWVKITKEFLRYCRIWARYLSVERFPDTSRLSLIHIYRFSPQSPVSQPHYRQPLPAQHLPLSAPYLHLPHCHYLQGYLLKQYLHWALLFQNVQTAYW